jgi:hypothetical protein
LSIAHTLIADQSFFQGIASKSDVDCIAMVDCGQSYSNEFSARSPTSRFGVVLLAFARVPEIAAMRVLLVSMLLVSAEIGHPE